MDVPYQIVKYVTPLSDAWVEANGPEGGQTSETPSNTYTPKSSLKESPDGKRIDYIMYNSGHEGVVTKLSIKRNTGEMITSRDFVRMQSRKDLQSKLECVEQGKEILKHSLKSVRFARIMYLLA